MPDLPAPAARRLQRPSLRDPRFVVGVLLVLGAVAAGARIVAMSDNTDPVYAAAGQIVPGQRVEADDLVAVQVQLTEAAENYVDATQELGPGTVALRAIRAGELVPVSALGGQHELAVRAVTVPVDPSAVTSFSVGSVVDVWVSPRDPGSGSVRYLQPKLLLESATVSRVPEDPSGLGVGPAGASVQIVVPSDRVADLIASVDQEARVTLVPTPGGPEQEAP